MGFITIMATCFSCHKPMTCNPNKVPSIRDPRTNRREPVCRECIERANPQRIANGLEPITILPGAYDAEPEENCDFGDDE